MVVRKHCQQHELILGFCFFFRGGLPEGKLLIGLSSHVMCGSGVGSSGFRSIAGLIGMGDEVNFVLCTETGIMREMEEKKGEPNSRSTGVEPDSMVVEGPRHFPRGTHNVTTGPPAVGYRVIVDSWFWLVLSGACYSVCPKRIMLSTCIVSLFHNVYMRW